MAGLSDSLPPVLSLDALGTLLEMLDPFDALVDEMDARGVQVSREEVTGALVEEMTHYRAGMQGAHDAATLHELRLSSTQVLFDGLPERARELGFDEVGAALFASVRFRPFPEVPETLAALKERGVRTVVVSNWDISLHEQLSDTGLDRLVDAALCSAEAGASKPDPQLLLKGLEMVGADPGEAWHVGDDPVNDAGAALAAGVGAVIVDRGHGFEVPGGVQVIDSLAALVGDGR
ncbi:MAG: HAD family hydrolase [Solirubrobacterales bacterium]